MAVGGPEIGVARYLESESFGVFDEVGGGSPTIFVGEEPSSPANVVVVLMTAGGRIPSEVSEEWLLTVRVRDESYEQAHRRLRDIAISLQEKAQGDFGGINIGRLSPEGPPVTIGRNDQKQWRVEQIFAALLKRSFEFA